jgi:hypothetical protein
MKKKFWINPINSILSYHTDLQYHKTGSVNITSRGDKFEVKLYIYIVYSIPYGGIKYCQKSLKLFFSVE